MINDETCKQVDHSNLLTLQRHFITNRVPASGSFNLTNRCNLKCVHCYLGDQNSNLRTAQAELNTGQWLDLIDQITESGCLYLLLTGGRHIPQPLTYI